MSDETRERIVAAGAEIIHRKGYNNTGIREILVACQVPKGSFYYYFPSKEAFGVAVVEYHAKTLGQSVGGVLLDQSRPPLERLEAFFRKGEERFADLGYEQGCPFGNLAQELGDLSPDLRERLESVLGGLSGFMAKVLAEAVEQGDLPPDLDTEETGSFIVEAWEGAILRMKTVKNGDPLVRCRRMVMERVLGQVPTP